MTHHNKEHDRKHGSESPQDSTGERSPVSAPSPAQPEASEPAAPPVNDTLDALRKERDDLLGRLQRVSADFLNYQKRASRDVAQAREFANEELIKELLHVLDDMERALEVARKNHSAEDPLLTGMELVYKKALDILGRFGLAVIDALGKPFDADQHAALMQEPSEEHPPRTVLKELQKGYRLKGRTIRPARVVISRQPEPSEQAKQQGEQDKDR